MPSNSERYQISPGILVNSANDGEKINSLPIYEESDPKMYSLEEAMDITGNGGYGVYALVILTLTALAMAIDMLGVAVVVAACRCDFDLDLSQSSIISSMSFAGPMVMSWSWGYFTDTRGRQKSLIVAMTASFIFSMLSVLSPNWIALAVLKFLSTSCCSCAQTAAFILLGESCVQRVRCRYILIANSAVLLAPAVYYTISYLILQLDFSFDMGYIGHLAPWRLLVLVLTLPLGLSAFGLMFLYESPKFLASEGRVDEAIENLTKIWLRIGGDPYKFPIKLLQMESSNFRPPRDVPLWRSVWEQTAPLFKPPLLKNSLQLLYITCVVYAIGNSFLMWFPAIADAFFNAFWSAHSNSGLCHIMVESHMSPAFSNMTDIDDTVVKKPPCSADLEGMTVVVGSAASLLLAATKLLVSLFASRRKSIMVSMCAVSSMAVFTANFSPEPISAITSLAVTMLIMTNAGIISSYFVDLYPTSYRGMAACLGAAVSRGGALAGINLFSAYLLTDCSAVFTAASAIALSAIVVALFLPADCSSDRKGDSKS